LTDINILVMYIDWYGFILILILILI